MKNDIVVVDDPQDISVLRSLGEWQAKEAASKRNAEKIAAWLTHDAGLPTRRPMVLMEIRPWEERVAAVEPGEAPRYLFICRAAATRG